MTRASMTRRSHLGANRSTKLDRPRAASKRKPYKILLEAVTQERKKLQSVLTYTAHAPPGYSYVPVGHPDLTEYCKDYCRKHNLDVHIVSAKPTSKLSSNPEKISHHVHRLGYHFPNEVVGQACDVLGYSIRNNSYQKNTQNLDTTRLARSLAEHGRRMQLRNSPAMEGESKDQIRAAIRDLFPKIPSYDLDEIVDHAFQEGTKRVGNAKELSLARRVQLAVAAHIRHNYTDYDRLLRVGSWTEARAKVEHVSLAKLKEWRDENDTDEVEETFREVIVLDDDESEADETLSDAAGSELSLEIVSSRAAGRDLQYDDFAHYPRVDAGNANGTPRRNHSRPEHLPSSNSLPARTVDLSGGGLFPRGHIQPLPSTFPRQYEPHLDSPFSRIEPLSTASATEPVVYGAPPRTQMRGADGRWYNVSTGTLSCSKQALLRAYPSLFVNAC
ncbi:hypothetical protein CC78DRAFT_532218 [Lojkania enalia]|uniref:DUF2293 domain-containing protein n=1 Tax=Lojkania enalia TaxID=147567 RepID=A0A9P4KBZ1_9PLEO|nr:hypothetical protein CC78DRAFT_532218 [Didymosphaeria enalia]